MKFKLFLIIVSCQVAVIVFLVLKTQGRTKDTIIPVKKKEVVFQKSETLHFFYEPRPGILKGRIDEWIPLDATYTINNDTLNERFDYSLKKGQGVYRIIVLGNSFTYGAFVNTQDAYPEILEDKLNALDCTKVKKFEVINLGMNGYDLRYSLERFKVRGVKYKPDLVLWLITESDLRKYVDLYQGIATTVMNEMKREGIFYSQIEQGNKYPYALEARKRMYQLLSEDDIAILQYASISELADLYTGRVILVSYPSLSNTYKENIASIVAQKNDWHYFSGITDTMSFSDLTFEHDSHPNSKGHKVLAHDFFTYLGKSGMFPCN